MAPQQQAMGPLTVVILIVSTTVANGQNTDSTGPKLKEMLEATGGKWKVQEVCVVSDDVYGMQEQITRWTDGPEAPNLVLTSGGTGFAEADLTPEAVAPLLYKQAPGLVHGMLAASLNVTPFAMMSRPVAGVRNKTLIVTLPGSPKGVVENLEAIIKVLPHGCVQAAGANTRELHAGGIKNLEREAGVKPAETTPATMSATTHSCGRSHGNGHGALIRHTDDSRPVSNDPGLGPGRRHRESPYPMVSVDRALELIDQHMPPLEIIESKVGSGLVGSVLAETVVAPENVPAFRASIVDGYAIVVPPGGKIRGVYPVVGVSHAGPGELPAPLRLGQVARITTGAPLPPGANCVVMVEDTILRSLADDGGEEEAVEILAGVVEEGQNIREVGSDTAQGSVMLEKGERISAAAGEVGLLASVGVHRVKTYRRPLVAVLSTGNELVDHNDERVTELSHGQVRDSNRPALISAIRSWNHDVVDLGIASDEPLLLEAVLRLALKQYDVVVTTGGVSIGELDLLKPTIERSMGGTIHFGRINMKPGKPTTFATVPIKTDSGERVTRGILSLPGNPASAIVTAHLFVLRALERLSGVSGYAGLPRVPVELADALSLDPRPEFHRASVWVGQGGVLRARSTGGQRSSRIGSFRAANALLCLPSGTGILKKGGVVDALMMGPLTPLT